MFNSEEAPVVLSHDPRIGKLARCTTSGFVGEIVKISRWSDGSELIEIKRGASGASGMSQFFELIEKK